MLCRIIIIIIAITTININADNNLEIGDIAPNYLGRDSSTGNDVNLEDHKGKVVIITFWASWCTPCIKELPILETIQRNIGIEFIKVVAINFEEDRKQYRKIKNALSSSKLTLTHDKRGKIGKKGINE